MGNDTVIIVRGNQQKPPRTMEQDLNYSSRRVMKCLNINYGKRRGDRY